MAKWNWYKICLRDTHLVYCAMLDVAETMTLVAVTDSLEPLRAGAQPRIVP